MVVQACWQKIRELYLVLYPDDLDWYPLTEVSWQIDLLEDTLRVTPAGKDMFVTYSMANMEDGDLKEDGRLKYGL